MLLLPPTSVDFEVELLSRTESFQVSKQDFMNLAEDLGMESCQAAGCSMVGMVGMVQPHIFQVLVPLRRPGTCSSFWKMQAMQAMQVMEAEAVEAA